MTYNGAMKMSGYVRFALMIILLVDVINSAVPQDRIDSQILDPFAVVDVKAKRPFCNAFTGCGRKRSSTNFGQNSNSMESGKIVRLPLPLYRALLRAAASQEMNNEIIERQDQQQRSMIGAAGAEYNDNNNNNNNRNQEIPQIQDFDIPAGADKIRAARYQYES